MARPTIHGKTLDEWLAAFKDRDPAVRKRAVESRRGTREVDPDLAQNERLQTSNRRQVRTRLG